MIRALVIAAATLACGCKQTSELPVARLEEVTAHVERMPRAAAAWHNARVGDTFVIGSAVRTGAASRAKLRVGKAGKLEVDPDSVVYFTRKHGRERSDVRVEAGTIELETGDQPIGVGEAVLDPSTRARIESRKDGETLIVLVGRAVLEDQAIIAGQRITIGPAGRAVAMNAANASALKPDDAAAPAGQIAVAVRDKPARVKTKGGERELAIGDHYLEVGTTVVVPAGSTVEVARGGARVVTSGPSELRVAEGSALVHVASGSVALHGEAGDAIAAIPGGSVSTKRGGDAAINVDSKETAVDAQRGDTVVETARGTQTLSAGQSALVARDGKISIAAAPPERTVLGIAAGESAVLHDPRAPTPLRVAFGDACPSTGVVEVAADRGFKKLVARSGGAGSANVLVPAGTFRYRVRCAGGRGATGTLRVVKDSGRTPLPKTAARTTVEMDGREYTILYQNLLPELTLSWRAAPRKASYTFVIRQTRGPDKRITSSAPTTRLAAGELREGSYRVWVEPAGASRSEESRMVIEFDNAAQSASLDTVSAADGKVRVKGTVIDGSTVSAAGSPIALDRHRRFETELASRPGEDGVAVRIAHPKAGIHYYVMRYDSSR